MRKFSDFRVIEIAGRDANYFMTCIHPSLCIFHQRRNFHVVKQMQKELKFIVLALNLHWLIYNISVAQVQTVTYGRHYTSD